MGAPQFFASTTLPRRLSLAHPVYTLILTLLMAIDGSMTHFIMDASKIDIYHKNYGT